jgi:hypothetical protein
MSGLALGFGAPLRERGVGLLLSGTAVPGSHMPLLRSWLSVDISSPCICGLNVKILVPLRAIRL